MSNTLYHYNTAKKDINLNSIPHRRTDENYQWSNGQQETLNDPRFIQLRKYFDEIQHLITRRNLLRNEILAYQNPTGKFVTDSKELKEKWENELRELELLLKEKEADLERYKEDMANRGFAPEMKEPVSEKPMKQKENKKRTSWKFILSFLPIWLGAEVFMSLIQWNSLRDQMGIEEIIIRWIALGFILLFFHFVAHWNKVKSRTIYIVFMGFDLLMLLAMMFLPIILQQIYPVEGNTQSVSAQWSFTQNPNSIKELTQPDYPFFVNLYRGKEWIPAFLSMVFFIVLLAIPDRKQKQVEDEKTPATESPVTTEQNEVNRNINYKERKIQETKNKIAGLTSKVKDISENPGSLADMLVKLEAKWNELLANEKKITDQKTDLETLLTLLEKELNYYRTEYLDILNHDEVKRSFITPEWSNRNDILTYYKIHAI